MSDMLMQYGLFFAEALTIVAAIGVTAALLITLSRRERGGERLEVRSLNERYDSMARSLRKGTLTKKEFKSALRAERKKRKSEQKKARTAGEDRPRVFVVNFRGDIRATAVASLREEITAVLMLAGSRDEVLVRLENAGGLVHEHGLAASQLMRVRERGIPLTVAVDKVAASGGYMMACVAGRIVAAPFAILGSVGVLAQVPNFHRLLDRHGIDFEMAKAGDLKRTVTLFGRNTEEDRERLRQQVEDVHALFKSFVAEQRPQVDIGRIATGEYWYGRRALELRLADELRTSDDYLLEASRNKALYEVSWTRRRSLGETVAALVQGAAERLPLLWRGIAGERRAGM